MHIEFKFIGWNNSTERNGTKHDKVWAAFVINNAYYAAWGARGKKLQFKQYIHYPEQYGKISEKKRSYKPVDEFMLFTLFPNFTEVVESQLTFSILADKVK